MPVRQPVRILATGIVFEQPDDPVMALAGWHDRLTPELRGAIAEWRAGDALMLTHTAFVEFDDGREVRRWTGTPQGPFPISTRRPASSELIQRARLTAQLARCAQRLRWAIMEP